jgi:hypothetical protein
MEQAPQHPVSAVASAARTTAGDSGVIDGWGGRLDIVAKLVVTAISGASATLTLTVEHADDPGGSWTAVDTFPGQTATTTGVTRVAPGKTKPFVRLAWTITGTTPSVTFSVALAQTPGLMTVG